MRSKMHHRIGLVVGKCLIDAISISQISLNERRGL